MSHIDPKFQGAIRSHKKEQNTSKFRNNQSPGTNVTAVRAYNLGPNSCTSENFPNKSDFPKQKHLTVKTHIEVINHRPQQKRSVNEDRIQTEEKKRKQKALWFQLLQGVSQSPSLDQNPLAANRRPAFRTPRSSLSAGPAPPASLPSWRPPWPSPRPSRTFWSGCPPLGRLHSAGDSGRSPPRPPPAF